MSPKALIKALEGAKKTAEKVLDKTNKALEEAKKLDTK